MKNCLYYRPTTLENYQRCGEVAQQKVLRYGPKFIAHIKKFCEEHKLKSDVFAGDELAQTGEVGNTVWEICT